MVVRESNEDRNWSFPERRERTDGIQMVLIGKDPEGEIEWH
jgi:hypothetical protein